MGGRKAQLSSWCRLLHQALSGHTGDTCFKQLESQVSATEHCLCVLLYLVFSIMQSVHVHATRSTLLCRWYLNSWQRRPHTRLLLPSVGAYALDKTVVRCAEYELSRLCYLGFDLYMSVMVTIRLHCCSTLGRSATIY